MTYKMARACLIALIFLSLVCIVPQAEATTITPWQGSAAGRTYNDPDFSDAKADALANGFQIAPSSAITTQVLASTCVFVINEASNAPTAGEISLLDAWVRSGGTLVVTADSGSAGVGSGNAIFSSLGVGLSFAGIATPGVILPSPFSAGIVGQSLTNSPASGVTGGSAVVQTLIHYATLGLGIVFGMGDANVAAAHNAVVDQVNLALVKNICTVAGCAGSTGGGPGPDPGGQTPDMPTWILAGTGGLGIWGVPEFRRRRRSRK